jgi:2-polyprenyl-6-methoxyphenol hydroxylase-like FAD-dependent oxidoreductase
MGVGRVLVVGGGIGGAATALALHRAGIAVTVAEAQPAGGADAGAFLTLAPDGMRALAQLGVAGAVQRASPPLRAMVVRDGTGTVLATRPLGDPDEPAYRYLTRARMVGLLQQEVERRGIALLGGKQLTGIDAGPVARFADGTSISADVVVGADGLHSAVRGLLDPAAAVPAYVGQHVFYGYADHADHTGLAVEPEHFQVVNEAVAFGCLTTASAGTWWFARVRDPQPLTRAALAAGTTEHWKAHLGALLADRPLPAAIVSAAHRVLVTNASDLPTVPVWHRGATVLLGDAAHAASPATGRGASMALEDAVVLAKALRDRPDPAAAFATYERLRRHRVQTNIQVSARMSGASRPGPPPAPTEGRDIAAVLAWASPVPTPPPTPTRR